MFRERELPTVITLPMLCGWEQSNQTTRSVLLGHTLGTGGFSDKPWAFWRRLS